MSVVFDKKKDAEDHTAPASLHTDGNLTGLLIAVGKKDFSEPRSQQQRSAFFLLM